MRVFLDTNVLVSAFATRGICADILSAILAEHQLILGETVLSELRRILRDKFKVPAAAVDETVSFLRREAVVMSTSADLQVPIRDPNDVPVLGEAAQGLADVLVTGDKDLLEIDALVPLQVLSPRGFWDLLRAEPDTRE
ncbi:MAG: putative toxin-antitoxin system toxin component, PIN family, partial [Gemmatimonadota bacterium]|nr:putative toxin-antitoxin system toxin component, PIN family [Gemmatimonadota bacterium]